MKRLQIVLLPALGIALAAAGSAPSEDTPVVYPASSAHVDYANLNALPDWRGIWTPKFGSLSAAAEKPLFKGAYLKTYQAAQAGNAVPSKTSNCAIPGMPIVMTEPYDIEFLFTPGRVTLIQEAFMQVRRIYTDGRPLPDDPDPTYNGHSIGHWEGGTLVVKTIGIKDDLPLARGGITHSDALEIVERIHLDPDDPDKLIDDLTYTDKKALKKPWHQQFSYTRHREFDQLEYVCSENDRNPIDAEGKTEYVLPGDSKPGGASAP